MSILKLVDATYTYVSRWNTTMAVKHVNAEFERGKFYAIVGKSGSGKTTMLSLLAGLALPTGGEVIYDGEPTRKLDRDKYRREDVSVIYQNYNLFPLLNILENVMYPMELIGMTKREAKQKAMERIAEVGLPETVYKRFPSMLSGGEQQRVAIARALCSDARIILADEPTGNLDTENGDNIVNTLIKLAHENGYCVIMVTHDLSIASKADVVLKMKDGVVSFEDDDKTA